MSIEEKAYTTIRISRALRNQIASVGAKDETFEDILRRIIAQKGQ